MNLYCRRGELNPDTIDRLFQVNHDVIITEITDKVIEF